MDLKVASASATDVERAAVDARARPGAGGARTAVLATPPTTSSPAAARRCGSSGTCCCRRCTPSTTASAGSAGVRSTTSPSGSTSRPPRSTAWPRFYALFSIGRATRHARCTCASTSRAAPPAGSAEHDLPPGTHPSPCLGVCERAPAALVDRGRRSATPRAVRAGDAGRGAAHRRRRVARTPRHRWSPPSRRSPTTTGRCVCSRRVGTGRPDQPRRLPRRPAGTRRCAGRSPSARPRSSARSPTPGSSAAAAPRSRPGASGMPSPASRSARTTSCATPTSPSPARSRTGC